MTAKKERRPPKPLEWDETGRLKDMRRGRRSPAPRGLCEQCWIHRRDKPGRWYSWSPGGTPFCLCNDCAAEIRDLHRSKPPERPVVRQHLALVAFKPTYDPSGRLTRGIFKHQTIDDSLHIIAVNRDGRVVAELTVHPDNYRPEMADQLREWLDGEWDPDGPPSLRLD